MTISGKEPDWSREAPLRYWDSSRKLLGAIRAYQKGGLLHRRLAALKHRFWSVVTGSSIPLNAIIGGGLILPHPIGVAIHDETVIGVNSGVLQDVPAGAEAVGMLARVLQKEDII